MQCDTVAKAGVSVIRVKVTITIHDNHNPACGDGQMEAGGWEVYKRVVGREENRGRTRRAGDSRVKCGDN